jgi:site-specific DNA recombinase
MIACAVYARKSNDQVGVADDQRSVERQIGHAKAYAKSQGWKVADDCIFSDDGISGAEFAARPGYMRMLNALKPRAPFSVLIVSELSRLGREQLETGYAVKQLAQAGVRIFSYLDKREVLLDTPTDKFLMSAVNFAAEIERDKGRQRVIDSLKRKAAAGHHVGGGVFGYDLTEILNADGSRSHVELRINPAQAAVIRRIFELAASGDGYCGIARRLNNDGALAPRPQQRRLAGWGKESVREVLKRDLYRGLRIWNKSQKRDHWGQLRWRVRPATEWIRVELPHLRIISDELWQTTRKRLAEPTTLGRGKGVREQYFLSGFGRCAVCGGHMQTVSRASGRGLPRRIRYGCSTYWNKGAAVCANGRMVDTRETDTAVQALLARDVLTPARMEEVIEHALALKADDGGEASTVHRRKLEAQLATIDAELANLTDVAAKGGAVPAVLAALQCRSEERQRVAMEVTALDAAHPASQVPTLRTLRSRLRAFAADRQKLFSVTAEARAFLRLALKDRMVFTPQADGTYHVAIAIDWERLFTAVPGLEGLQDLGTPGRIRTPRTRSASSTRCRVSGSSPGPSNQIRLGSLRNQINWRRAYRRFSWTMSARVAGSSRTPRSSSMTWRYTNPPNGRASAGTPLASSPFTSSTMPRAN